jgi:glutathione peroxidase
MVPLLIAAAAAAFTPAVHAQARAPASAACPATLQHTFARLQDEAPQNLCQYSGRVVLVVNTASYCGFTPQYKGLEALYDRYRGKGLVVLGFPSNDFLQEKSNNKDIAEFCENTFGVRFPMFGASHVRGDSANPLFKQLAAQTGTAPKWNFYKYLIARDGKVVGQWGSQTTPEQLAPEIEKQLRAR